MPTYSYHCTSCNSCFELFFHIKDYLSNPICDCGSTNTERNYLEDFSSITGSVRKSDNELKTVGDLANRNRDRMSDDKKEIMEKAKALEAERDKAKERSPWFTWGGSILQISIVLLTASILAASMPMFWVSTIVGAVGAVIVSQALWMWLPWLA